MWRLIAADRPHLYVKHGAGRFVQDVIDEKARLAWLAGRWPVPDIQGFIRDDENAWLVTTALAGRTAEALFEERPEQRLPLVRAIATFLARLHATPASGCPFDASLGERLAVAGRNLQAGLVDEEDFDDERKGWSAQQVWDALQEELPLPLDQVLTHGDFSLGNLSIHQGAVSGLIDVGRAGLADPYQDLAILWNSLRDYGDDVAAELWRSYPIAAPDERRLRVHLLLDELF